MELGYVIVLILVVLWNGCVWSVFVFSLHSFSWPSVKGQVTSIEVEHLLGSDGENCYYLDLKYTYVVNGIEYNSDRYFVNDRLYFHFEEEAQNEAAIYDAGNEILVYFQKSKPKNSVLVKKLPTGVIMMMVIGILALLFAINIKT